VIKVQTPEELIDHPRGDRLFIDSAALYVTVANANGAATTVAVYAPGKWCHARIEATAELTGSEVAG
jgi:hypothetical protein